MKAVTGGVALLLFVVCFGVVAGTAGAQPTEIGNWTELQEIQTDLDGEYVLTTNLTAETDDYDAIVNETLTGGVGFLPIGNTTDEFTGSFDGNGYTISDLFINRTAVQTDRNQVGLFGVTNASSISNLTLDNAFVKGELDVGGVAGVMNGGSLSAVAVTDSYVRAKFAARGGGLVGQMNEGSVTDSHTSGEVHGSGDLIGGLVGQMNDGSIVDSDSSALVQGGSVLGGAVGLLENGSLVNVHATGNVTGETDEFQKFMAEGIGGLVGVTVDGSIADSTASGDVTGVFDVGGLIGYNAASQLGFPVFGMDDESTGVVVDDEPNGIIINDESASVTNVSASGTVTGEENVGGLIGFNQGGTAGPIIDEVPDDAIGVTDATATGAVTGIENVGGLIGANIGGDVSNTDASGDVSGNVSVGGLVGVNQAEEELLRVEDVSAMSGITYATASGNVTGGVAVGGLIGSNGGIFGGAPGGFVAHSSASGTVTVTGELFEGEFVEAVGGGLIGATLEGTVGNVSATGDVLVDIDVPETVTPMAANPLIQDPGEEPEIAAIAGGLIGFAQGGFVAEATAVGAVTVLPIDGDVGFEAAGGLIGATTPGFVASPQVEDAAASGDVSAATNVGGLIGANGITGAGVFGGQPVPGADLLNVSASGTVSSSSEAGINVGGLLGQNLDSTVEWAVATGDVDALNTTNVGGLIGYNNGTTLADDPVIIGMTVAESYATGSVSGGDNVGGLIGLNTEDLVTDSYAVGNVAASGENVGGLVGYNSGENATVTRAYAAGFVDADGPTVGGLVGSNVNNATVVDAYWDIETTEQAESAGNATGLATGAMKGAAGEASMFDFAGTWAVVDEPTDGGVTVSYPFLVNNTQDPAPGLETVTLLSFTDQGIDDDTVTVDSVDSQGTDVAVIITYEDEGDLIVAGLETGVFENESVTVTLESLEGFPGDHTAHLIAVEDLSAEYTPGDVVSNETAAAIIANQQALVTVEVQGVLARDTTGDGKLNDVTGDNEFSIADVQALFNALDDPVVQRYAAAFDFAGANPDRVSVFDVQALFTQFQAQG